MSEAKYTPEQQIQRAYDIMQIKNVMGRHAWYHAFCQHPEEYAEIWSKRDDVSWGNSMGYNYGREAFYDCYVRDQDEHPEVEPGICFIHTLTTCLVELAEDGQTAQGMWITPGFGCDHGDLRFMYERYAVDFIKEDGEWKIWHLLVGTDFTLSAGYTLATTPGFGPPLEFFDNPPEGFELPDGFDPSKFPGFPGAGGDKPGVLNLDHYQDTDLGWPNYPPFPKPYKTFSETVSYGPESFLEKEGK